MCCFSSIGIHSFPWLFYQIWNSDPSLDNSHFSVYSYSVTSAWRDAIKISHLKFWIVRVARTRMLTFASQIKYIRVILLFLIHMFACVVSHHRVSRILEFDVIKRIKCPAYPPGDVHLHMLAFICMQV